MEKFLDGETEYEIFDLGVNPPLEKLKKNPEYRRGERGLAMASLVQKGRLKGCLE